jgi:hypothetical protein
MPSAARPLERIGGYAEDRREREERRRSSRRSGEASPREVSRDLSSLSPTCWDLCAFPPRILGEDYTEGHKDCKLARRDA